MNSIQDSLRTAFKMTRERHNQDKILTNAERSKRYRQSEEEQYRKGDALNRRILNVRMYEIEKCTKERCWRKTTLMLIKKDKAEKKIIALAAKND